MNSIVKRGLLIVGIVIAYYLQAQLGAIFAPLGSKVTYIWFGTGFSLAVVYLLGNSYAVGIFIGALLSHLFPHEPQTLVYPLLSALGSTLEAIVFANILRWLNFQRDMLRFKDFLIYLIGTLTGFVAGAIGVSGMLLAGLIDMTEVPATVITWFAGSVLGAVVFGLPIITFRLEHYRNVGTEQLRLLAISLAYLLISAVVLVSGSGYTSIVTLLQLIPIYFINVTHTYSVIAVVRASMVLFVAANVNSSILYYEVYGSLGVFIFILTNAILGTALTILSISKKV